VLGIYGLVGAGRSDLLQALYGTAPVSGGEILLYGQPYHPTGPEAAIAEGIAYLSEDRKLDGFVPLFTPISNTVLPVLARYARFGFLDLGRSATDAREALDAVDVRGDITGPMRDLSGGNQQKVLFARVTSQRPRLLLLDEPTKGVDIGAKREIHHIIRALVADGDIAAIVVSSEEEEVLDVSDDIVIFRRGVCDGVIRSPAELDLGDLRRLAWVTEETSASA
jgi:ribose transport system ATP-binding protein